MFDSNMPGVETQEFTSEGQDAVERVRLRSGLRLEIYQQGCETLRQEFRFFPTQLPRTPDQQAWVSMAADLLGSLSEIDASLGNLALWAREMEARQSLIRFGAPVQVGPNYFLTVDRIASNQEPVILVILEARDEGSSAQ